MPFSGFLQLWRRFEPGPPTLAALFEADPQFLDSFHIGVVVDLDGSSGPEMLFVTDRSIEVIGSLEDPDPASTARKVFGPLEEAAAGGEAHPQGWRLEAETRSGSIVTGRAAKLPVTASQGAIRTHAVVIAARFDSTPDAPIVAFRSIEPAELKTLDAVG